MAEKTLGVLISSLDKASSNFSSCVKVEIVRFSRHIDRARTHIQDIGESFSRLVVLLGFPEGPDVLDVTREPFILVRHRLGNDTNLVEWTLEDSGPLHQSLDLRTHRLAGIEHMRKLVSKLRDKFGCIDKMPTFDIFDKLFNLWRKGVSAGDALFNLIHVVLFDDTSKNAGKEVNRSLNERWDSIGFVLGINGSN